MSNKPFIIRSRMMMQPMLPTDSPCYDEIQQSRIQLVQAINGYITINMLYESFKLIWSFWHYKKQCPDYAYLSLGFMCLNLLWSMSCYWGFRSIRAKKNRHIKLFGYCLIVIFFLRLLLYVICGIVMKGYVPNYMNITKQQLDNIICSAIYPQALYIISGIFEGIICMLIMFLVKGIYYYLLRWEKNQLEKHIPMKMTNMSDY